MKGLSLWQPWASLIAIGAKSVETRGWPAPPAIVGQRIAVHAAKETSELLTVATEPFRSVLRAARDDGRLVLVNQELPLGAIVATAVLTESFRMDHTTCAAVAEDMPNEHAFGDWRPGRFGFKLSDVERLREPIPYRGAQKFFDIWDVLGQPPRSEPRRATKHVQESLL